MLVDIEKLRAIIKQLPAEMIRALREPDSSFEERLKDLFYFRDAFVNEIRQVVSDTLCVDLVNEEVQRLHKVIAAAQKRLQQIEERRANRDSLIEELKGRVLAYEKKIHALRAQRAHRQELRRLLDALETLDKAEKRDV